jgi:hypothetical protein
MAAAEVAMSATFAVARITDDPEGDLIADMQTDRDIPGLFGNLKAMHDFVSFKSRGDPKILAGPASGDVTGGIRSGGRKDEA